MTEQSLRSQLSFVWVLLANLVSLVVIWQSGWQGHALLLVYWLETGVLLGIYILKITRADGTDDPETITSWTDFDGKSAEWYVGEDNRTVAEALVSTFVWPWLAWGLIVVLFGFSDLLELARPRTVALAGASLVAYQLLSYWNGYVRNGAYERRGPVSLLVEPAPHVWALVLTVILGMGATAVTESAVGVSLGLVFFKTCADLVAHRRARKRDVD